MFAKMIPEEVSIWIGGVSKADSLLHVGGQHPVPWGPEWNGEIEEGRILTLLDWWGSNISLYLPWVLLVV